MRVTATRRSVAVPLVILVMSLLAGAGCDRSKPAATNALIGDLGPAFEQAWRAIPPVNVPAPPSSEKVTVVIFLDWQCPACRAEYRAYTPVLAELQAAHPGAVRVLMKDFPLNARCNAVVPVEMHPAACEAAVAVRLAAEHRTTQAMVEWLFANQETLTPASVKAAAASVGQIPDFDARYASVMTGIAADVQDGAALQIQSTPSVFVNGRLARLDGRLLSAAEFRQALLIELR